jgi:hypothetical protein
MAESREENRDVTGQPSQDDTTIGALVNRLKESGESAFNKLSEQLLENATFMAAFRRAVEAKGQVDRTVSGTMDFINLPSKNDVGRVLEELESVGAQLARQQKAVAAIERSLVQLNAAVAQLVERVDRARGAE